MQRCAATSISAAAEGNKHRAGFVSDAGRRRNRDRQTSVSGANRLTACLRGNKHDVAAVWQHRQGSAAFLGVNVKHAAGASLALASGLLLQQLLEEDGEKQLSVHLKSWEEAMLRRYQTGGGQG